MIHMSHLSFVQCEQIKFRPKKNVKVKVFHSAAAVGIVACVCVCVGGGGGGERGTGGNSCHVTYDMNFYNFFNLLSFTIPNKASYI